MIRADGFTFRYPTRDAPSLEDLSFEVEDGKVLGVIGPVEAGKTSLSMALSGFAPSVTGGETSGGLEVAGRDPRKAEDNKVAMVFEDYSSQLTQIRIIDEVMAPLVNRGVPRKKAKERARELLDQVRLDEEDEEKFSWELSGGQQQRLAIASALAIDPEVLIFDTATDMLDPEGRDEVSNLIVSLVGEKTLVVTENDPDALVGIADKVLALKDGKQVGFGSADTILRDTELLDTIGVRPPICLDVAHNIGLRGDPITSVEFVEVFEEETRSSGSNNREEIISPTGSNSSIDENNPPDTNPQTDTRTDSTPILKAENVTYEYSGGNTAVKDINMKVHPGEVHAVIGGNGAGKTTLSKLLVGLMKPDSGKVVVSDKNTKNLTARDAAESVGIAFQNPNEQLSERTVVEEIKYPLVRRQYESTGWFSKRQRYDESYIEERAETVRELVGISEDLLEEDPAFLPQGQKRLVTIASALSMDPDAIVLDEPTAGIDALNREIIENTIQSLCRDGKGIVLIDHSMEFVCKVADTVTVLEDGRVAMQEPVESVFRKENWDWLSERYMRPPRIAQLADWLGTDALTPNELETKLTPLNEVSR